MRSTRPWTTSSALALLAAVACSRGAHRDDPAAEPAPAAEDDLARDACACTTLPCVDAIEQKIVATGVESAVKQRAADCADQIGRKLFLGPFHALTDDLCACADRACYDALGPRVNALMDPRSMKAAFTPAFIDEMRTTATRFDACDAKWRGRK
jgi:hypothetical protein